MAFAPVPAARCPGRAGRLVLPVVTARRRRPPRPRANAARAPLPLSCLLRSCPGAAVCVSRAPSRYPLFLPAAAPPPALVRARRARVTPLLGLARVGRRRLDRRGLALADLGVGVQPHLDLELLHR